MIAVFLIGMLIVPTAITVPVVMVRRALSHAARNGSAIATAMPLAGLVVFLLQALLVWWATGEAYRWSHASAGLI